MFNERHGGRPTFIADIDFKIDRALRYYSRFYKVATKLNYQEIMAISRCFNINHNTIYQWKSQRTIPNFRIMLDIIDWGRRGKPLTPIPAASRDAAFRGML